MCKSNQQQQHSIGTKYEISQNIFSSSKCANICSNSTIAIYAYFVVVGCCQPPKSFSFKSPLLLTTEPSTISKTPENGSGYSDCFSINYALVFQMVATYVMGI